MRAPNSLPCEAPDGLPMPQRLGAILAVAFGVGLSVIDSSIANVALPAIARQLDIAPADSVWVVNAYQLAVMAAILPLSALGGVWGYRRVYVCGLALFTAASLGCALSASLPALILSRVLQGLGAAAVTSVNTTLIRFIYPRERLGRGMGINATVVAVSSVAGPALSAAVLGVAEWPWLFAVNIPAGAVALVLCSRCLPDNPVRAEGGFSWRDAGMSALTFGLMMASFEGFAHGADLRIVACGAGAALLAGGRFAARQLRAENPVLPVDLLRIPIFAVSLLTSVCSYLAQMLAMVALPFWLQHTLGYDDVGAGLLLTAWPAVVAIAAPTAGYLVERVHAGALGGTGLAAMAAGLFLLGTLPDDPAAGAIIWRLTLCGAGFAFFQSPNNSVLIASAPPARSGAASGMLATARLTGQTLGAAIMALLFQLVPGGSTRAALLLAGTFALAGSAVSFARLRLPLPDALVRKRMMRR